MTEHELGTNEAEIASAFADMLGLSPENRVEDGWLSLRQLQQLNTRFAALSPQRIRALMREKVASGQAEAGYRHNENGRQERVYRMKDDGI